MFMLDLSSAFDALDHDILLNRLEQHYGICGSALVWFRSYLEGRTFSVKINNCHGNPLSLLFGVPQGSILGPLLFILYCKDIECIALKYGIQVQIYADDTELYIELNADSDVIEIKSVVESCLNEIKTWMSTNFLKLNESKTELIIFNPPRHPYNVPFSDPNFNIKFNDSELSAVSFVESLGVTLTPSFQLKSFIVDTCQSCNYQLSNLKIVKNSLNTSMRIMLINSLILTKLDYCNSLLAACTQNEIFNLQKVMNNAVRFIFDVGRREHITPYLKELHFLPIKQRILFKLSVLAHKIIYGYAPNYLTELFECYQPMSVMNLRPRSNITLNPMLMFTGDEHLPHKCVFTKLLNCWNELPIDIRLLESAIDFKRKLKTFYFREAFETD